MRARSARRPRWRWRPTCRLLQCSCLLLAWLLDGRLVGRQCLAPEALELAAKRAETVRVELIDAVLSRAAVDDEARILQHLQVLRDGRPADRQLARELGDGLRPPGQPLEDGPPGRVAKGRPAVRSVSLH